jgi:heptaprenyl diphosphate synthase
MKKQNIAYFGVFVALAIIFSYVESLVPINLGIPGTKLGLANLVIVIALYLLGTKEAFLLSIIRIILVGFLFGNMFGILYSLAGAILSLLGMWLCKITNKFSIVGVSVMGGVLHNVGQFIVAMLVMETVSLIYYFPFLLVIGTITGLIIGLLAWQIKIRVSKIVHA